MRPVSYFQRYSQRENHVTNNTLLMLRHLDRVSPTKVSALLSSLFDDSIQIGLGFHQQTKGTSGVEDGYISQVPLHLFIEAKRGGKFNIEQLRSHIRSINARQLPVGSSILLGLATDKMTGRALADLKTYASERGIKFYSVTFTQLVEELLSLCPDYEQELKSIVEDFKEFLISERLLTSQYANLAVVPCGTSWPDNVRFGIYYEPPSRPGKWSCRFLGVYHEKQVSHVGVIVAVALCQFKDGEIQLVAEEFGRFTDAHRDTARNTVEQTTYFDLKSDPERFYFVDEFVECHFKKLSEGGMRGNRYLNLTEYTLSVPLGPNTSARSLAAELRKLNGWF